MPKILLEAATPCEIIIRSHSRKLIVQFIQKDDIHRDDERILKTFNEPVMLLSA